MNVNPAATGQVEALASAAGQVSSFLIGSAIVAILIISARLWKSDVGEIEIFGTTIRIPVNRLWMVFVVLTALHLYYAIYLLGLIASILNCNDGKLATEAWNTLRDNASERAALFQMSERFPGRFGSLYLSVPFRSAKFDLLMLLHVILVTLMFFATVRWGRNLPRRTRLGTLTIAIALVSVNWLIGSQWALLASDLPRVARNEPRQARNIQDFLEHHFGAQCPAVPEN